jgi:hypothetical protein
MAGGDHEPLELASGDRPFAHRKAFADGHFVARTFLAAPFRFVVRRAHGELARRHHHHFGAPAAFPEALLRFGLALFAFVERVGVQEHLRVVVDVCRDPPEVSFDVACRLAVAPDVILADQEMAGIFRFGHAMGPVDIPVPPEIGEASLRIDVEFPSLERTGDQDDTILAFENPPPGDDPAFVPIFVRDCDRDRQARGIARLEFRESGGRA